MAGSEVAEAVQHSPRTRGIISHFERQVRLHRMCLMRMFVLPMSALVTWRHPRLQPTPRSPGWRLPLVHSPPLLLPSCSDLKRATLDDPQVHMGAALQTTMHMTMPPTRKMGKQGMLDHVDRCHATDMLMELNHHDVRFVTMMIRQIY